VLNGVLWVIYSGAAWSAMPRRYPSYQTCHRRFKAWHASGVFKHVLFQLYGDASTVLCETMKVRMRAKTNPVTKEGPVAAFASVEAPTLAYMASLRRAA
jgi:transposase